MCGTVWSGFGGVGVCCVFVSFCGFGGVRVCVCGTVWSEFGGVIVCVGQFGLGLLERGCVCVGDSLEWV
jgi:hypothetical protein